MDVIPDIDGPCEGVPRVLACFSNSILPPGTKIPDAYANGSSEDYVFIQNLALFLTSFYKAHIRLLESTPDNRTALLTGLEYLIDISYVDDIEAFKVCLDYWNYLVTELFEMKMLMISRMAKPEEVLNVEHENGNIVHETLKDNDVLVGKHEPFVSELLTGLPMTVMDLEPCQIHSFYESVGHMIQVEPNPIKRDEYLQRLMELSHQKWAEIIGQARQSVDYLKDQNVIRIIGRQFVPPMMDPILGDYAKNLPDAREYEVLPLFAIIINKNKGVMTEDMPRIFQAIFECTLVMNTKNFEDYPELRLKFISLLRTIAAFCFPTLICLLP
ncbi:hypothetical protein GIB67_001554 [Kingdonia uniflora]|uniref:Exportin-1 C-terminal domain-containing protein n=1 Tax=Kingdonia uniflora TaxID=39325 RepID=A0A7J7L6Q3_9MAGN|nr:hypothetical protein GIB67_001554 [Kingdonia uniflora]